MHLHQLSSMDAYATFLRANRGEVDKLYDQYAIDQWSLADRGYLASIHPLELWMVAYLHANPGSTLTQMNAASEKERQDVYQWLLKTKRKHAQDRRIAGLLEVEFISIIIGRALPWCICSVSLSI